MNRTIDDIELRDVLLNPTANRTGQYICDCPYCGKSQHFYINRKTQLWDCKKCGQYGNIYKLLSFLGKTYLLGGRTIEETNVIKSIISISDSQEHEDIILEPLPSVKMPVGWRIRKNSTPYLLSRGITAEDCQRYRIGGTTLSSKYRDYVLLPIYDDGEIRGFIGRYGDKNVPENRLRYNNSVGTEFAQLLYGYDEITNETNTVVLVEGVFDKIAVDKTLHTFEAPDIKCVCTFGKKISAQQIEKLKLKGVSKVILLYDYDAIKDIKKYGLLLENTFVTYIVYTTKKDIDECSREEALAVFEHPQSPRDFNDNVIGKLKR